MGSLSRMGMVLMVTLFVVSPMLHMDEAVAEAKKATPLEGARFDTSMSLKDNLNVFMGRDVYVHLRSGKTIQGYVKSVGDHFLHLERLAGRDFYDALVRIEDIAAMEAKFRDMR
jgi:uncharacterized membrane protein